MSQPALATSENPEKTLAIPEKEVVVPEKEVIVSSANAFPLDTSPLFDHKEIRRWPVKHPDFPNDKWCQTRYPTDEEWAQRSRKMVLVENMLGRGKSEYKGDIKRELEADRIMFDKIRQDADTGPVFDDYEAKRVIDKIDRLVNLGAVREGGEYVCPLDWWGRKVTHVLKTPTERQLSDYQQISSRSISSRPATEHKFFLEPSADFWNKLIVRVEGYADPQHVPINHKHGAIAAMIGLINQEMEDEPSPEF